MVCRRRIWLKTQKRTLTVRAKQRRADPSHHHRPAIPAGREGRVQQVCLSISEQGLTSFEDLLQASDLNILPFSIYLFTFEVKCWTKIASQIDPIAILYLYSIALKNINSNWTRWKDRIYIILENLVVELRILQSYFILFFLPLSPVRQNNTASKRYRQSHALLLKHLSSLWKDWALLW